MDLSASSTVLVIAPERIAESCLSVPAVRALKGYLSKGKLVVATSTPMVPFWEREAETVIDLGKKVSLGGMKKLLAEYTDEITVHLRSEEVRKYWGDKDKLFVLNKEHESADGNLVPFSNPKGLMHEVERYLALPQLFSINTQVSNYFPERSQKPKTGKFLALPRSEYGDAYYKGLDAYHSFLTHQLDQKSPTLFHYELEEGGNFIAEKAETVEVSVSDIPAAMELLLDVDFLIGPEGGLVHLAAYLGVPTMTLFGPGNTFFTRPLGMFHQQVQTKVECQPCLMAKCLLDHRCKERISEGQVRAGVLNLLADIA